MGWWNSREESKEVHKNWQESLENKDLSKRDISIEKNENYKANVNMDRSEIINTRDKNKEAKDNLTEEELNRSNRLEKKQIDNIKSTSHKQETKSELENTRQNKKSWW